MINFPWPNHPPTSSSANLYPAELLQPRRLVGIYCGSFNPIHEGHVALAQYTLEHTSLDELWLVVSPQNPFKQQADLAPDADRLAMARIAVQDTPCLCVSDVELSLPKPSYTIDTLDCLQSTYPDWQFVLLMGADNLAGLPRWKESERLLATYPVWVYPRAGYAMTHTLPQVTLLDNVPEFPGCATDIREAVARGEHAIPHVHPAVEAYIYGNGLYQK